MDKAAAEAKEDEKKASEALATAIKAFEEAEKLAKAAETDNAEPKTQLQAATEAKALAQKGAADAAAKSRDSEQKKEHAIKLAKEAATKLEARDVTAIFYSSALNVQVAAAPITVAAQTTTNSLARGAKLEIPVTITRLYGFTDGVELTVKEADGLKTEKITIPKDQTTGKLVTEATADAKTGEQKLTLQASLKFNGQDLKLEQPITLRLSEGPKRQN